MANSRQKAFCWSFFMPKLNLIIMKQSDITISEVKLIYRTKVKASDRPYVKSSRDAFGIFMKNWDLGSIEHIEEFKLMLLTKLNKVLGVASISRGGISGTVTDVRIILQYAIKANASGIIICHNHPSGHLQPGDSDLAITKKIKESASVMDIQLLDHLIIVPEGEYYSIADSGLI
jgi:DNA repair protein RadC